mgnify:FL=1
MKMDKAMSPKGLAIAILAKKPTSKESVSEDDEEMDFDSHEMAAQELLDAIESNDAVAVSEAFKSMFTLCQNEEYDEEETEDMDVY